MYTNLNDPIAHNGNVSVLFGIRRLGVEIFILISKQADGTIIQRSFLDRNVAITELNKLISGG